MCKTDWSICKTDCSMCKTDRSMYENDRCNATEFLVLWRPYPPFSIIISQSYTHSARIAATPSHPLCASLKRYFMTQPQAKKPQQHWETTLAHLSAMKKKILWNPIPWHRGFAKTLAPKNVPRLLSCKYQIWDVRTKLAGTSTFIPKNNSN